VTASRNKPADALIDLPQATRRVVADFLKISARPTCRPDMLARALHDALALSALHAARERERKEKGAGVAASPLN
jgi:hypothetical protein